MYCVYVLQRKDTEQFYYGYTTNLEKRCAEHFHQGPWELIYYEAYKSEHDARTREQHLKHYGQAVKALKSRLQHSMVAAGCGATGQ